MTCYIQSNMFPLLYLLAVSVLLPSSESVSTDRICTNVYNAQNGKLEVKRFFKVYEAYVTTERAWVLLQLSG